MKTLVRAGLMIIAILALLAACGGGGGGGGDTPTTLVSGVASKGTIVGGTVKAYSIVAGAVTSTQIGSTATTGSDGTYNIDVGGYSGPLAVVVTGGTYIDETTGNPVELVSPLRAFVANVVSGRPMTAAVTPLTEIAARYAESQALDNDRITAANAKISTEFKVADILTSSPSTDAAYTNSLSAISALSASSTLDAALTSLKNNIVANGSLVTTVAVTKDKSSALIGGSDIITLTVSVLPVPEANTPVDFAITGSATFGNGLTTAQILTPSQQVTVKSNVAGDSAITATCNSVSAGTTVSFSGAPTVTVTADRSTAVATGFDPIALTATLSPAQPAGTDVTFTVSSGTGIFSNGLTSYTSKVGASSSAQATLYSSTIGSVTVSAESLGGSGTSASLSFTKGVSSYSTLLTALGPAFVMAYDAPASLPAGTVVNFTATGPAVIRTFDGNWSMSGTYAATASSTVASAGTYPGKAVVYLKCTAAGDYTVTAVTAGGTTVGNVTKTCSSAAGTSALNVYLTPTGAGKLGSKQVTNIRFNLVAAASSNTSSIVSRSSSYPITAVEQKSGVATFVNLSPNATLTSTSPLFTATYGYSPSLPSFSVAPVSVTLSDSSTVTLLASDFEIR